MTFRLGSLSAQRSRSERRGESIRIDRAGILSSRVMSVKLARTVLKSDLRWPWKPLLHVLAFTAARDDGTGIWIGAETLAQHLGLHRTTVSRLLAEATRAGFVKTIRHGGRWKTAKGRTVGRHTERVLDVQRIETYRHPFGGSDAATRCRDLVATPLHDAADLVATPLHPNLRSKIFKDRRSEKDRGSTRKECLQDGVAAFGVVADPLDTKKGDVQ